MKNKKLEKVVIILTALFVIASLLFMFGKNIFSGKASPSARRGDVTIMPEASASTEEITHGDVVEQSFICSASTISQVGIVFNKIYTVDNVDLTIELLQGNRTVAKNTYDVSEIEGQHRTFVIPPEALIGTRNKSFTIKIYTVTDEDTGLGVLYSSEGNSSFLFGRERINGTLCFSVTE
ncbi:MAG: hypothetical protein IKS54_00135 [Erysipelotrichaceae bacterium]|nr:hypothetical protein [Erysipelotrichaceae bacterium]